MTSIKPGRKAKGVPLLLLCDYAAGTPSSLVVRLSSDEQKEKLEELDFVYDVLEDQWNAKYNLLVNYQTEHGHSNVLYKYCTEEGIGLGEWVYAQRLQHKNKKLTDERKEKLEVLN